MGTILSSPPAGKPPADQASSSDAALAAKKSRKAPSASSPGPSGTAKKAEEPRSFAAVYRKTLAPSRTSDREESAEASPEKGARKSPPADRELHLRHEKSRKKKVRTQAEALLEPLVVPVGEKSAKTAHLAASPSGRSPSGSAKPLTPVLWGPQNGRAALGKISGGRSGEETSASPDASKVVPGTDASFARAMGATAPAPPVARRALSREALTKEPRTLGEKPEKAVSGEAGRAKGPETLSGEASGLSLKDLSSASEGGGLSSGPLSSQAAQAPAGTPASAKQSIPDGALLASGAEGSGVSSLAGAETAKAEPSGAPPVLPSDLSGRVSTLASGGGGQVALEVRPPHLGPVGVRVHVDPTTRLVKVELSSHDPHIRHLLSEKEGAIKESLSQSGFVLDRFQVASQSAPAATAFDAASGLASPGGAQSADLGGRGSEDSGNSPNSQGASTADPGAFSRQGANQSGRDQGGGQGLAGGGPAGPSYAGEEPEELLSALPAGDRGLSRQAGYHRIA